MFGMFMKRPEQAPVAQSFQMHNPTLAMMGLGMMSGRNNRDAFGNAMQGAMIGNQMGLAQQKQAEERKAREALNQYIGGQGLDPQTAAMLQSNPQLAQSFVKDKLSPGTSTTADLQEYAAAKKEGFEGNFVDWKARARGGATELSLTPQYGLDAQGNPVLIQIGKDGRAVQTALPEGVQLDRSWINAQNEAGKLRGQAQADLPAAMETANQAVRVIDEALAHPGRETATGKSGMVDPRNYMAGTEARDYQAYHNQIKGKAFLEAYQSLKGAGQITEVEGLKAEQAVARLDLAQTDESYKKALEDLRSVIQAGMERAKQRAGVSSPQQTGGPKQINSPEQYQSLPPGSQYIAPDGSVRTKR